MKSRTEARIRQYLGGQTVPATACARCQDKHSVPALIIRVGGKSHGFRPVYTAVQHVTCALCCPQAYEGTRP